MIQDKRNSIKVLGCLFKHPTLFSESEKYIFRADDFLERSHRIIFSVLYNMYHSGAEIVNITDFYSYLDKYPEFKLAFEEAKGNDVLLLAIEIADIRNFSFYYDRHKKLALLRRLKSEGYDISDWYSSSLHDIEVRQEMEYKLERATIREILQSYQGSLAEIESDFVNRENFKLSTSDDGLSELIESFKLTPEVGAPFEGKILSTVARGARRGKVYLMSGEMGTGKSRQAVMQACRLSFPIRWNLENREWENIGKGLRSLLITTELDDTEIQTMILAYVAGVNEEHILNGVYPQGEEERIEIAKRIIEKYGDLFYIFHMPDPNIAQLNSNVRRLVITKKIDAVFFDYIHTTPALLSEFSRSGLREDVALNLLSSALKSLANELDIIVWTGTQVNREVRDADFADANTIRGARSIVDKVDFAAVLRQVTPDFLKTIAPLLKQGYKEPNMFMDVYKNRRSAYKRVRIWLSLDLGTLRMKTLFLTDEYGDSLPIDFLSTTNDNLEVDLGKTMNEIKEQIKGENNKGETVKNINLKDLI